MRKVAGEDSVRRAWSARKEEESEVWLKKHLKASYEPRLEEAWALDVDTTVKPLYGHQEEGKVGYNRQKPGRPSQAYHSYFIANLRMVMVRGFCVGMAIEEASARWKDLSSAALRICSS